MKYIWKLDEDGVTWLCLNDRGAYMGKVTWFDGSYKWSARGGDMTFRLIDAIHRKMTALKRGIADETSQG